MGSQPRKRSFPDPGKMGQHVVNPLHGLSNQSVRVHAPGTQPMATSNSAVTSDPGPAARMRWAAWTRA